MNNEQYNQIIDEAYENYVHTHENFKWTDDFCIKNLKDYGDQWDVFSKEEFINKCKTDPEFSEKWELKIEEKELSLEERSKIWNETHNPAGDIYTHSQYNENNLPTKLITVTYKDKTIESYD